MEVTKEIFWKYVNKMERNTHSTDYVGPGESKFYIMLGNDEVGYIHRRGHAGEKYYLNREATHGSKV